MEVMKAAVFEREGSFVLKDVPVPQIEAEDQVIVEVEACSICGTDVHITATPPGYIATPGTTLGHEFCGHIIAKGAAVKHLNIGDRVVANPNNYCGNCVYCRKNLPNECEHIEALGIDYDGAFAKYCRINSKVAYKISEDVPAEVAACVEPLACALGVSVAELLSGQRSEQNQHQAQRQRGGDWLRSHRHVDRYAAESLRRQQDLYAGDSGLPH